MNQIWCLRVKDIYLHSRLLNIFSLRARQLGADGKIFHSWYIKPSYFFLLKWFQPIKNQNTDWNFLAVRTFPSYASIYQVFSKNRQ